MNQSQLESLGLNLPSDAQTLLMVESGLQWVLDNTTLEFDINNEGQLKAVPAQVRLFVLKFVETMSISAGVASESIEGLSQSFSTGDKAALLWDIAASLLGKWLVSPVKFIPAQRRWE